MKVLAMEPYYGGSHKAFIDGWAARSAHEFTLLTLPPHHFKWRMRHAGVSFAQQVCSLVSAEPAPRWDVIWCSSMLNLADFLALAPRCIRQLPSALYFHENQLFYPRRLDDPRDVNFGLINWVSALSATEVWFNSAHNRDTMLEGLKALMKKMPDQRGVAALEKIAEKSKIQTPAIDLPTRNQRPVGKRPVHILWAARFEHDKGPETFFAAIRKLRDDGVAFQLSVVGEQFKTEPEVFSQIRSELGSHLRNFGFLSRPNYEQALEDADIIVSTAAHEFFGLAVMEAVARGCVPLLPRRLVYPELFEDPRLFYDGSLTALCSKLRGLAALHRQGTLNELSPIRRSEEFTWNRRLPELDRALHELRTAIP